MSRSYKKPYATDYSRSYTKFAKRQASKKVRRHKGKIPDGGAYKKIFPSYSIHDYSFSCYADKAWFRYIIPVYGEWEKIPEKDGCYSKKLLSHKMVDEEEDKKIYEKKMRRK